MIHIYSTLLHLTILQHPLLLTFHLFSSLHVPSIYICLVTFRTSISLHFSPIFISPSFPSLSLHLPYISISSIFHPFSSLHLSILIFPSSIPSHHYLFISHPFPSHLPSISISSSSDHFHLSIFYSSTLLSHHLPSTCISSSSTHFLIFIFHIHLNFSIFYSSTSLYRNSKEVKG